MELRELVDKAVLNAIGEMSLKFKKGFRPSDISVTIAMSAVSQDDELITTNPIQIGLIKNYGAAEERIVKVGVEDVLPKDQQKKVVAMVKPEATQAKADDIEATQPVAKVDENPVEEK